MQGLHTQSTFWADPVPSPSLVLYYPLSFPQSVSAPQPSFVLFNIAQLFSQVALTLVLNDVSRDGIQVAHFDTAGSGQTGLNAEGADLISGDSPYSKSLQCKAIISPCVVNLGTTGF